jgi:glycosyltransferase involved in cell wall biosynthesis
LNRRKVLTVLDALEVGGVASHLTGSLGRLARSELDLRVANLGPPAPLSEQLRKMKIKVYDLGVEGPYSLLRRALALRRLIKQLEIDVVHSYGHAGPVARLAAGGVPVVSTVPDPDSAPTGWRGRVRARLERRAAVRSARLLAPSDAVRRHYAELWGAEVEVVPNFLDGSAFQERLVATPRAQARTRLGVAPDDIVLLYVGRGHPGRGLERLMEAFHVARIEQGSLRLFLTGKESGIAPARAVAESLDLGDSVVFLGVVEDVAPLYAAADVFVLPSCPEGWSMSLLEAMAAGLPVVTTSDGGIPEPASASSAVLVEDEAPEALARGILQLTLDPRRRADMSRASSARAAELDAAVWTPRLQKLYADVIRISEE